jgi:hypothetical protein
MKGLHHHRDGWGNSPPGPHRLGARHPNAVADKPGLSEIGTGAKKGIVTVLFDRVAEYEKGYFSIYYRVGENERFL